MKYNPVGTRRNPLSSSILPIPELRGIVPPHFPLLETDNEDVHKMFTYPEGAFDGLAEMSRFFHELLVK